jgi:hypothetical protein
MFFVLLSVGLRVRIKCELPVEFTTQQTDKVLIASITVWTSKGERRELGIIGENREGHFVPLI